MTFLQYLGDRTLMLLANLSGALALAIYLRLMGLSLSELLVPILLWAGALLGYLARSYVRLRRYFREQEARLEELDQKHLIVEVMDQPITWEGRAYLRILKRAGKSMIEEVTRARSQRDEYREYIEQWVHEIKVPITTISLICENNKSDTTRRILPQLEQIRNEVDRTLYVARADNVEKDYLIRETTLQEIVDSVLAQNKQHLIQRGVRVETEGLDTAVYTDGKWAAFILNQALSNSVKYMEDSPCIRISARPGKNRVQLDIQDNGGGIAAGELPRIFEKGFTGSNGRKQAGATGMGLYLCRKLCGKLGISIFARSEPGAYTRVSLVFPVAPQAGAEKERGLPS
ncbi:MAG: sensor histidine kinase [Clostridiales bacterium]|nr:sensor histidine kinase [Clostridiales bacterium]